MRLETLAVHAGERADDTAGSVSQPLYLTSTFERDPGGEYSRGFVYGRYGTPNRAALEDCVAQLEGGSAAAAFASGMATAMTVLQALDPGDHVVAPLDAYFGTGVLLRTTFIRWGLEVDFVDMTDTAALQGALRPNTRLIWFETPTNPLLRVADIQAIVSIARNAGITTLCDNTFATPVLQQPFTYGVDLIFHSATKYLGGHSDVVGGVVTTREEHPLFTRIRELQSTGGAGLATFDSWLVMRGIKTLPYRMRGHCTNARAVADFLQQHPRVEAVHYPGLAANPGHEIAARQMSDFGGMLSFQITGTAEEALGVAARTELITQATSLGGVHSLIEHRASVEGPHTRSPGNLLRLSVGLEHPDDLIKDLEEALKGA